MEKKAASVILICANTEWCAVKNLYQNITYDHSPFGEWFAYQSEDIGTDEATIIFFQTGWGKVAAAAGTQYVIDRWKPSLLVNIGTCGGFDGELTKGELIMAQRTVIYDIYEQMGDPIEHIEYYSSDIDTDWIKYPYPIDVRVSTLVSGDRDLCPTDIQYLKEMYSASAGDWESGAIAWVARNNQTKCLILRGVTDLVGSKGGEAYDGNIAIYHENTKMIMYKLIESLPGWLAQSVKE